MDRRHHRASGKQKKLGWLALILTGIISLLYLDYVMIFRQQTEPSPKERITNTDAVLYSLESQINHLKNFEELYHLAFDGRMLEMDYGTIPIPGLKSTKTLNFDQNREISICTSMTPQGLCIAEDYLLISAYCHTHTHNSVIYVLDKDTHTFLKEIVLQDKSHVGGLAFDKKHRIIWVSTNHGGRASASGFSAESLETYDLDTMEQPIAYTYDYDLHTLERDSFMTYADGCLYIGHFSKDTISVVQKFFIEEDGSLKDESTGEQEINKMLVLPEEIKWIPKQTQGIAFYGDKVILSQSYGFGKSALLVHDYSDNMYHTDKKYTINKIIMPQKLQQIYVDGTDLYILFESAAYAYSAQPLPKVDRVLKLDLKEVVKE